MITADRFVANKSLDFDGWVAARQSGVTATEVANAATPAGFRNTLEALAEPEEIVDNPYLKFGRDTEIPVMLWLKDRYGLMPNEWLIRGEANDLELATPDGLSLDHNVIAEVKTTGKDWPAPPIRYRRQVQWQLLVTGAEYCQFAWMLRVEANDGSFQPGWIEPKVLLIERDENMIAELQSVADRLWQAKEDILAGNEWRDKWLGSI